MGMTIEEAEKLLDDLATMEELIYKKADDASGYTRSGNESIRTSDAKMHEQHAKEYRQILRYLAEYQLIQADYENRLRVDMVAMLEEISDKFDEQHYVNRHELHDDSFNIGLEQGQQIIQQKINKLKGEENGNK